MKITTQGLSGHYLVTRQTPFVKEESIEIDASGETLTIPVPEVKIMMTITISKQNKK